MTSRTFLSLILECSLVGIICSAFGILLDLISGEKFIELIVSENSVHNYSCVSYEVIDLGRVDAKSRQCHQSDQDVYSVCWPCVSKNVTFNFVSLHTPVEHKHQHTESCRCFRYHVSSEAPSPESSFTTTSG